MEHAGTCGGLRGRVSACNSLLAAISYHQDTPFAARRDFVRCLYVSRQHHAKGSTSHCTALHVNLQFTPFSINAFGKSFNHDDSRLVLRRRPENDTAEDTVVWLS